MVTTAVDRVVFEKGFRHAAGHQQQAPELLGVSRMALGSKLRGLRLPAEKR